MSGDVSATETTLSAVPSASDSTGLFTAFKDDGRPVPRGRWALALLAALFPVVLGVGFWTLAKNEEHTFRLVTPQGIKSLRGGMTADQVVALLGRPITFEQDERGADCYRYGTPNFINPQFLIYKVCYEDGKLRDVTQRKFSAWSVEPETGTFAAPEGGAPAASPSKDG
jgi:hypothetical protein